MFAKLCEQGIDLNDMEVAAFLETDHLRWTDHKQIATDIGVSEGAVKATLQHLFRKTHVRTRAQLVRIVIEGSFSALPE
jgi:FixJ family two-component response regulator